MLRFGLLALGMGACAGDDDPVLRGDDDDDATDTLTPWSEVETTQSEGCCRTVTESFEWTTFDLDGLPAMYAVPPEPIGALVVFHGTNGVLDTVRQTDWIELYNLLYPRGIAIVATLSLDRDAKQWDRADGPDNVDVPRIDDMLAFVDAETDFSIDMPLVTIGFSQGSVFSELYADVGRERGRDVVGCVMHNGGGRGATDLPTLFVSAEHDPAAADMAGFASTHASGTLLSGVEGPLDPYRFAKLVSFDRDESQAIFDELVARGIVDEEGSRTLDFGDDAEATVAALESQLPTPYPIDVANQLRVTWAMHRFSAQNKLAEAEWIDERLRGR